MAKKDRIYELAEEILAQEPRGIGYSELCRRIREQALEIKHSTIRGTISAAPTDESNSIERPSRGWYVHSRFLASKPDPLSNRNSGGEEAFYASLADWMEHDLEGVTKAIKLGGSLFNSKWGTPDVIGKKVSVGEIFEERMELISAEVKIDPSQLVTAFGQACAYCLFSHRSYVVVPKIASKAEIDRLTSLCQVFGIGLVFFDESCVENPDFSLVLRARRQEPDYYYVNEVARQVKNDLFG